MHRKSEHPKPARKRLLSGTITTTGVAITLILLWFGSALPASAQAKEKLVILPFEIVDNIPAPGSEARHDKMLREMVRDIAERIDKAGIYQVMPQQQVDEAVAAANLGTAIHNCNHCEIDLAKQLGGDKVMVGWVYKMSLLILTLHIEIKDVASERTLLSKAYDFRGDNEKAWRRAAQYMVRDLGGMIAH
ncbi:MAG: DUF3280 domain-containing protein [Candidatus Thiodiazotropha sp.]